MTAAKEQEYFEYDLNRNTQDVNFEEPNSSELEKDDVSHSEDNGNIIVDAEGNYYYQFSQSLTIVEPLPKTAIKKVPAVVISQIKRKSTDGAIPASVKKPKVEISELKILKLKEVGVKKQIEIVGSETANQERIYEFDENEQDPDDPKEIEDPDCESKGIIKAKKSTANDGQFFKCMACAYRTNKKFLLSRHLKVHSDECPYKCDVCERGFKTNAALKNHRNVHLGRKPHACSSCDKSFTTSGELVRHVRYRHTHIKPHKCTECDYSSVEMSKLRRHMRCHTGERPYQCPHCTYASVDSFKLKRHIRIHTGEKPYLCDICHARFTQSNSLKLHRLIHSVSEKPVFQCNLCPTTCGRKTDLRLHIKNLHSSDQPLPCKRCGKELPDRYSYKMHIKTHQGEKCFRCEYCPYASISQRHLESHVLIHLDVKPFVCQICLTSFRQKQLLVRHTKLYHSDNYEPPKQRRKDHKCPHCNKMFAFNGNLIRHMEIHDPDSQRSDDKDKLKLGRLKRVKADGTVVTISPSSKFTNLYDENEELFYDENEEEQEEEEEAEPEDEEEPIDDEEIPAEVFNETKAYNEDNIEFIYDEYDKYEEYIDDEEQEGTNQKTILIDVKTEQVQPTVVDQAALKKNDIIVKDEQKPDKEIMLLHDDQNYMVIEVLSNDEDNDDQQQDEPKVQQEQSHSIKQVIINEKANTSQNKDSHANSKSLISDYFGFQINAEEDDEEGTKGAIKILEMIEQE